MAGWWDFIPFVGPIVEVGIAIAKAAGSPAKELSGWACETKNKYTGLKPLLLKENRAMED